MHLEDQTQRQDDVRIQHQIDVDLQRWTGGLMSETNITRQLTLCPSALLPELQPAPCFLSAIIGQID